MDERFAIVLALMLVAGVLTSLWQHRAYSRATRRMAQAHEGLTGAFLVSGRGKGRLRGAIVLLVVDGASSAITAAEAMVGASVFARFRPRPELLGPAAGAEERASDPLLRKAVEHALEQFRTVRRSRRQAAARD